MNSMAKIDLPYVQAYSDRHGKRRHYYRRPGLKRIPLPGQPGTKAFMAAYAEASDTEGEGAGSGLTKPNTINALVVAYYQSPGFRKALSEKTQNDYRLQLDAFREKHGDKSFQTIQPKHLDAIFESMMDTPAQASNLRKRLLKVFGLAIRKGWRNDNPVRETERIKYTTKGFTPWTEDDIAQFRKFWGEGSKPVQALRLFLTTGVRRSDARLFGRQHVRDGVVRVRQVKGGEWLVIPAHPDLLALIEEMPEGQMTLLLTEYGAPFSAAGLTGWFAERARKAGLDGLTPHGLRKAVGRRLAEAGCSEMQIAAVLGHKDPSTAKVYTKDASQIRLAADAMGRLESKTGTGAV